MEQWHWFGVKDGDPRAAALYERHYSCVHKNRRRRTGNKRVCGPGERIILLTLDCRALFVWQKSKFPIGGQTGVYCAVFRNESDVLSSVLIREAEQIVWQRWPGERLFTFVNPRKVRSSNPGYCFKMAGWHVCGMTKGGLVILEKYPDERAVGHMVPGNGKVLPTSRRRDNTHFIEDSTK